MVPIVVSGRYGCYPEVFDVATGVSTFQFSCVNGSGPDGMSSRAEVR